MSNTTLWIGTSWKMNKSLAEARKFAMALAAADEKRHPQIQRFVIPPFTLLREVKAVLGQTSVMVGAQNMHWAEAGAWTGEVSAPMLIDCGIDIVELGHSERREHFGETDETVGLKTQSAIRHGLTPLICVGETLADREAGREKEVLDVQVRAALSLLQGDQKNSPLLFAYEPVWAIGENGIPAKSDYADARMAEISQIGQDILGHKIPCLYGGSVNQENCEELVNCQNIDGLFIGRSAWQIDGYLDILIRCAKTLEN